MKKFVLLALLFTCSLPLSAAAQDAASYPADLTTHIVEHQKYPSSAKLYSLEGDAIISIQVDKQGNIVNYRFIRDTNHPILHDGIIAILKDSNPVPPPPADYFKDGNLAEFMFPIAFRMGMNPESLVKIDQEFQSILLRISQ